MTAHTPGPWHALNNGHFWEIENENRAPGEPRTIGDVCFSDPENCNSGLQEANARLIAAAPDLLAACEAALAVTEPEGARATSAIIRAAITKATQP